MGRYRANDTSPERGSDIVEVELLRASGTTSRETGEAHDQAAIISEFWAVIFWTAGKVDENLMCG